MDMFSKKPIDDLFLDPISDVYLIKTPTTGTITNCVMASKKGAKFWLEIISEMKQRFKNPSCLWLTKHWIVMNTTGPMLFNSVYHLSLYKNKITFLPKEQLFPSACDICSVKPCTVGNYTDVLEGTSWCGKDTMFYNWIFCNSYRIVCLLAVGLAVLVACWK
jgi:mannosyltransferase OCH1-like enzyme